MDLPARRIVESLRLMFLALPVPSWVEDATIIVSMPLKIDKVQCFHLENLLENFVFSRRRACLRRQQQPKQPEAQHEKSPD
ncbi:hypothetical protein [Falsiroseomonas tokyonensis]|uniref:Uncharacterized protein n=1 Tax=Falsiroseomonas tokyonensis TaxID=430521 RepID=A0ABV7BND7_9PROT|nr:hypothetical protein [Falsiroseomonas tokyonensis]MBU8536581.1 hypothetical protein [Falsiroseomonas tokyonensis]